MPFILSNFYLKILIIVFFSICAAYVDFSIFIEFDDNGGSFDILYLTYLAILKFICAILTVLAYCVLAISIELKLKSHALSAPTSGDEVNFFSFISQQLAFNYYTAIVRLLSEIVILTLFLSLIFSSKTIHVNVNDVSLFLVFCVVFALYLYFTKFIRQRAAEAQNKMISDTLPLLEIKQQLLNNDLQSGVNAQLNKYLLPYKLFNTSALFLSQIPRGILDLAIIFIFILGTSDSMNIYSLGVLGLRAFTSFNNIVNQIPLILHWHPYVGSISKETH